MAKVRKCERVVSFGLLGFLSTPSAWVLLLAGGLLWGCSQASGPSQAQPGDQKIGDYCNQVLDVFCPYAITHCGVLGTVQTCKQSSLSVCCQGACNRLAGLNPQKDGGLEACLQVYAGSDGGLDDAGHSYDASTGISCDNVRAGFAPPECSDLVQLR